LPRPASPFDSFGAGRPGFGSSSLPPGGYPPPRSSFGSSGTSPPPPQPAPKPASSGSSFLDEWLAKRKETIVKPASQGPPPPKPPSRPEPPKQSLNARPAQPKQPLKMEASVDKSQIHLGEFKIDQDIDPSKHQSQVVHIDKEGKLSFGK
jgi:hypothetical protein